MNVYFKNEYIKKYNLANQNDLLAFNKIKPSVLRCLKSAYGRNYFGDEIYSEKFNNNPYLAYLYINTEELRGVLIRKPSGKLIALAVMNQFQKEGIGFRLLEYIKEEHIKLTGEVSNSNKRMVRLMRLTGFKNIGIVFDQDNKKNKILFEYKPQKL